MSWNLPRVLGGAELAVETRDLRKTYGRTRALDGLDLMVPRGSVYLLVGPNGSGKTTTFRILMGLLRPDRGTAMVGSHDAAPDGRTRALIGFLPEGLETGYPWLRVRDLIDYHSRYFPTWDRPYQAHLEGVLNLRRDRRFGTLSKGEARAVQLLLALAHRPAVLIMDEPTDGLDPLVRDVVLRVISEHLATTPTTVIVATHVISEMERLAEYVGVIRNGALVTQLERNLFQSHMRRYAFSVPDGWQSPDGMGTVLRRDGTSREMRWVIWGSEAAVQRELTDAGAVVRASKPLTLQEAAVVLLGEQQVAS